MPNKPRVYNLSWFSTPPGSASKPAPVTRHNKSTVSRQKPIGVIILYPALATPEILVGDSDKLELLLLTSYSEDELRRRIRFQLKISEGLDAAKPAVNRALFIGPDGMEVGASEDREIEIEQLTPSASTPISTHSGRFSGFLDKRPRKIFADAGYTNLFRVAMSNKVLEAAMGDPDGSSCGEPQDRLIDKLLNDRTAWAKEKGKFHCFKWAGEDVDLSRFDHSNPIQSYHPVYHYAEGDLQFANLGHVSDVHLASRQQILAKTRARVIDYACNGADSDLANSPFLGHAVNVCSKDLVQIMNKLGKSDADLLLIGGDLVDFLRNTHLSEANAKTIRKGKPSHIWQALALDDNYTEFYKDGVDMIVFFSILMHFCRATGKPAYAVTGNHDCYHLPYGLSPRINPMIASRAWYDPTPEPLTWDEELAENRANEGIASDHNLTFYEAILAFGDTYRELKSGLGSPFKAEMFDWFYMVFTPWANYSVELPRQSLVAFAWGETEDLFDTPGTGHGFGHLPRTDDAVSFTQLALLETAIGKKKKVILMTHFTFVSYADSIPVAGGDTTLADVYFSDFKNFEEHNLGTFELSRDTMLGTHCGENRDIQIILTGHSHRRALYLVDSPDYSGRNSLKIRHYDFPDFARIKSKPGIKLEPAIIVSDSGGTIPRYNYGGEFNGRGSDPPSGTTVLFDQDTGDLAGIAAARADCCQPRIAVAIDYLDIQEKTKVVTKFESQPFLIEEEKTATLSSITFEAGLNDDLTKRGLWVESLAFYLKWSVDAAWYRIHLHKVKRNVFRISNALDVAVFSDSIAVNKSRGNFLAMQFNKPVGMDRYNANDPWCWEFQVDFETSGRGLFQWSPTHKVYKILRDKHRAEYPDFEWRRNTIPSKYQ